MDKELAVLRGCPLFGGIEAKELAELLACLRPVAKTFAPGEIIALAGKETAAVGIVLRGEIAVTKENAAGERVIMAVLGPAEIFGEMGVFSPQGVWPATVIAQREAAVLFAGAHAFQGTCSKNCGAHRALIGNMLRILAQKALLLQRKMDYLTMKTLRGKVAAYLLEIYGRSRGDRFLLPLGRRDLADYLHVTRPSLSRELCRMRDEGMIDFHRNAVAVKDLAALRRAALSQ